MPKIKAHNTHKCFPCRGTGIAMRYLPAVDKEVPDMCLHCDGTGVRP